MKRKPKNSQFSSVDEALASIDQLQELLLNEAQARLKVELDLAFVSEDERQSVILLCRKQLENGMLSKYSLKQELVDLDTTHIALEQWFSSKVDKACEEAKSASYVRDCDLVALYRLSDDLSKVKLTIRNYYWIRLEKDLSTLLKYIVKEAYGCTIDQAENKLGRFKRDIHIFETLGEILLLYDPSKGRTFENWVKNDARKYWKKEIVRIKMNEEKKASDLIERYARGSVENEPKLSISSHYLRKCLKELYIRDPEGFIVFVLIHYTKIPLRGMDMLSKVLQTVKNMREKLQSQEKKQPDYDRWSNQSTAVWEEVQKKLSNFEQINSEWETWFDAQRKSERDFEEGELWELEIQAKCRTIDDMVSESNELLLTTGHERRLKELEFMINWRHFHDVEAARFQALEALEQVTQEDVGLIIDKSQGEISRMLNSAKAVLASCLGRKK